MSFVRQRTAPIREKRLGTIGAWYGSAGSLLREAAESGLIPRTRTFAQDAPSDLIYALRLLSTWRDVVIVVHGPAGCGAALHASPSAKAPWIVTNIGERDSILGGDARLRAAILEAHRRHQPKAIIVVSSPVVVINNDDIDSTTEVLREELGIPIVSVYADGFRSKLGVTGLDVAVHGLIKYLRPAPGARAEHIALIGLTEHEADVEHLVSVLNEVGIEALPYPLFGDPVSASRIGQACLSVSLNPAEAHYACEALKADYGVPLLATPVPIGVAATSNWLNAIGQALGKEEGVAQLVARETRLLEGLVKEATALRGRRIFINLSPDIAFAFARLAEEIGLVTAGLKVPFLDPGHIEQLKALTTQNESLPVLVGDGQSFEEVSLLRSVSPDLYIGQGAATHAMRLGIATLDINGVRYLGFAGMRALLARIERCLANTSFQHFLAEGETEPYSPIWRQKSAYWYIKYEVK